MEYLNIAFDEKNSSRNLHRIAILIFLGICHEIAYERANGKKNPEVKTYNGID